MLIQQAPKEQCLSFKIGGVKISPEIDLDQLYSRSDLNCPGIFKVWDLPCFVVADGKRLTLVFRRMPDLSWGLTDEADFKELVSVFQQKIFVALSLEKALERLLIDCAQIICRRIAQEAALFVGTEKTSAESFLSNAEEFELITKLEDGDLVLEVFRHLPTDRLLCLSKVNLGNENVMVGIEKWDEESLSEEFVSRNICDKGISLEKIFKSRIVK